MIRNIRAQIAVEYLIFIAIFLLFFQAILLPSTTFTENVVTDVFNLTQTKENIDLLANNITSFSNSSGFGKRTMYFYLPASARILDCNNETKVINFQVLISNQNPKPALSSCNHQENICTFESKLYIGDADITCESIGPGYSGDIVIEKTELGVINVTT